MFALKNIYIRRLFVLSILIIICLAAYRNALDAPFIWDDDGLIVKHPLIKDLANWPRLFFTDLYFGTNQGSNFYRPLQSISFLLNYYFSGLDPFGYHVTNLILQILVAFLVYILLEFLSAEFLVSFAAALFFAVSPLYTECVTYISGRADLFMGLFVMLSFFSFIRMQSTQGVRNVGHTLISLFCFILALLSKELALVTPLVFFAYLWYLRKERKPYVLFGKITPFLIVCVVYFVLRYSVLKFPTYRPPALTNVPFLIRLSVLPAVITTYFRLLIVPLNLHMSWELIRPVSFWAIFFAFNALGGMIVLCGYILRNARSKIILPFMLAWGLIFFLPQSGIFPINAFVAEHFVYLSSISFYFGLAYLMKRHLSKLIFFASVSGLVLFYALQTYTRNMDWRNPELFYTKVVQFSPASFQGYNNLGLQFELKKEFSKAVSCYKKALEIKPDLLEAHSNLANVYYKMAKYSEAEKEFLLVLQIEPKQKKAETLHNLGALYEVSGLLDKALEKYKMALVLNPELGFTHYNIGNIYLRHNNEEAGIKEIMLSVPEWNKSIHRKELYRLIKEFVETQALKVDPAIFHNNLGVKLAGAGLVDEAIPLFSRAIELSNVYLDAHYNMALVYAQKGLKQKAVRECRSMLKIDPQNKTALKLLSALTKSKAAR